METIDAKLTARLPAIDIARFYAMFLVYYGHVVEQVMYLGSVEAAVQYKFIYSFHMPLFFLIAGTVASQKKQEWPVERFVKTTMAARLAPYVLFSVLLATASLVYSGWFPLVPLKDGSAYVEAAVATLLGFPAFCIPLWFMALLLSVELFHYLVSKYIRNITHQVMLAAALYVGGYYLNRAYFFVGEEMTFWFVNEVPVVYCFYLTGILLRRSGWLEKDHSSMLMSCGALACLAVVIFTYDLNQGPFRIIEAVVIVLSGHGHVFYFLLTAFAGSLMILLAAKSSPSARWLLFMGRNSLSLFCLNGVFYHFVNPSAAGWFADTFAMNFWTVLGYSTAMTLASLLLCIPVVIILTRFVPQLMGKPRERGPLLPPLIRG